MVYSTDRMIPRKERKNEPCLPADVPPAQQNVRVRVERKGRGGKAVTVIEGLSLSENERGLFLKQLRTRFGTGGTSRDTALEIQGDHRDMILSALESMGYKPKRSGG
ncbi:MAG: translation initiation factor [Nitrospirota bacterium]